MQDTLAQKFYSECSFHLDEIRSQKFQKEYYGQTVSWSGTIIRVNKCSVDLAMTEECKASFIPELKLRMSTEVFQQTASKLHPGKELTFCAYLLELRLPSSYFVNSTFLMSFFLLLYLTSS